MKNNNNNLGGEGKDLGAGYRTNKVLGRGRGTVYFLKKGGDR